MAYLSNDAVDARDRIDLTAGPYILADGRAVAFGAADLFDNDLAVPIDVHADGSVASTALFGPFVWTGTTPDGTKADQNCNNWIWIWDVWFASIF